MHGVSIVALGLLADANDAAPRAAAGSDDEALHDFRVSIRRLRSWIRAFGEEFDGVAKKKHRRRLKKIAEATNPSRDLQVQFEWLDAVGKTGGARRRSGVVWFEKYLGACRDEARGDLRAVIERDFPKVYDALDDAFSTFKDEDERPLAVEVRERLESYLLAVTTSLDNVTSIGDERGSHKARIRVKRLRYLIEPLVPDVFEAGELVTRLKVLQDAFGRVHDAHVLSHALRDVLESAAVISARRVSAKALGDDLVLEANDPKTRLLGEMPRAGIVSLMRHLRSDLDHAFAAAQTAWTTGRDDIEMLAAALLR